MDRRPAHSGPLINQDALRRRGEAEIGNVAAAQRSDARPREAAVERCFNGSAGGAHAGTDCGPGQRTGECRKLSLAAALSWAVSDADRGVTACDAVSRQVRTSRGVDRLKRHARHRP